MDTIILSSEVITSQEVTSKIYDNSEIIIASSVLSIAHGAFAGNDKIKSIRFEANQNYITIDDIAFSDCNNLEQLNIVAKSINIGNLAVSNCSSLKEVAISCSELVLGYKIFDECSQLVRVYFPNCLEEIPFKSFIKCYSLKHIRLPANIIKIGDEAFECCTSLEKISIPKSVISIGTRAFERCYHLKTIIFQDLSKISFGNSCFFMCLCLKNIVFPSNSNIQNDIFSQMMTDHLEHCQNIDYSTLSTKVDVSAFEFSFTNISSFIAGEQLTGISEFGFYECKLLEKVDLSRALNLKYLSKDAFKACDSLKEIILPKTVDNQSK